MTNANENKEIATKDATPVSVPADIHHGKEMAEAFAGMIELAKDKSVDAASLVQLWQIQKDMVKMLKQEKFNQDLNAALGKMPCIVKDKAIVFQSDKGGRNTPYASLENIKKAVDPILLEHGITMSPNVSSEMMEGRLMISAQPIFRHDNGHVEKMGILSVPPDDSKNDMNATKRVGSSTTYGARYATIFALGLRITGVDDDGGAAAKPEPKEPTANQKKMLIAAWKAAELGTASLTEYMDNLRENNSKDALFLSKHLSKDGTPYYGKLVEQANAFDDKGGNDNAS